MWLPNALRAVQGQFSKSQHSRLPGGHRSLMGKADSIFFFCFLLNVYPGGLLFISSVALYQRLVCILSDISRCFVKATHLKYCLCCIVLVHNSFYFQTGSVVVAQKFFDRLKIKRPSEVNGIALVSTVVSSLNYFIRD